MLVILSDDVAIHYVLYIPLQEQLRDIYADKLIKRQWSSLKVRMCKICTTIFVHNYLV